MNIITSFEPINTREKIDSLIGELKKVQGAMNPLVRREIYENIKKAKLQMYFNDNYPESMFADAPKEITAQEYRHEDVQQPKNTADKEKQEKQLPVPQTTLGSSKHIYGTYIEMAFHNFYLNMRHIYKMVFGKDIMEQARLNYIPKEPWQKWDEDFANEPLVWRPIFDDFRNALPEEKTKIEELLARHFPMLVAVKDFTSNSRNYKSLSTIDILERFSQTMRVLRNEYSHYKITLFENQIDAYERNEDFIAESLKHAFLGSKRIVKARFALTDEAMECTEQYRFHIDKRQRDEHGRPKKVKEEIPGFRYSLTERNSQHLSSFGLVFLTSLFLEKKYSKILTDKLRLIPQRDQAVVNELIAVYRIRLTNEKFHVTKGTDALAMDMLTELRRCPIELFDMLEPENQNKFRIKSEEGENDDDVLMVRHSDRFAHLVMKYIDEAKLFHKIRFQVSLGKYFFKFYDKHCIDNAEEPHVRSLSKNVNGFGRIDEMEVYRNKIWDEQIRKYADVHKNSNTESPYVTDHHPRYVTDGNRIAMRIFNDEPCSYLPELTTEGARNLAPSCWLSIYELPALAFLVHLKGATAVEEIIMSTVANYRKLFADIADGKLLPVENETALASVLTENYDNIQVSDLPKDILDYLLNNATDANACFNERAKKLIDKLIEQTEYMKERFAMQRKLAGNPKANKLGKKSFVRIQPGKLASFLAKDMMLFQPNDTENKNKLTSLNFRILQSVLALYSGDIDALRRVLTSAHIIGKPGDAMCNPIVMDVMSSRILPGNVVDFYQAYLNSRLKYLRKCKNGDLKKLGFLHADRVRWQEHDEEFYKAKAGRFLKDEYGGTEFEKPIELPRGLFDRAIREELMTMDSMKTMATDKTKNISYLIYGYFKNVMLDDCSPVYDAPRTYPILNLLYRESPRSPKVYYSTQEIRMALMRNNSSSIHKDIEKCLSDQKPSLRKEEEDHLARLLKNLKNSETTLKRYKIQDMMLFLIAKKLLENERDTERVAAIDHIHLRDILDKDTLSQKIKFSVDVKSSNGYSKNIYRNDLKLKDYAKFYRFLNDRRLPSLLDLIRKTDIEHSLIEEELNGYDKVHPAILEQVFEYERQYYKKCDIEEPSFREFSKMINEDDAYNDEEKKVLRKTRNSFAHCLYPKYYDVAESAKNEQIPLKAKAISDAFGEIINRKK